MKKNRSTRLTVTLATLLITMAATALAQTSFTLEKRVPAQTVDRYGNLPLGAVIRTDERYGDDGLIQGPRGWHYWNRLENPKDYQNPNLWGDKPPTYFMGQLKTPPGTTLTMRGHFPHARYFKIALYRFERNTFIALGDEDLAAWDIEPDPGSSNPYRVGADRTVENRDYTLIKSRGMAHGDSQRKPLSAAKLQSLQQLLRVVTRALPGRKHTVVACQFAFNP